MEISCREVRREMVNYMEDDLDAELRFRIERHFRECDGCTPSMTAFARLFVWSAVQKLLSYPWGSAVDSTSTFLQFPRKSRDLILLKANPRASLGWTSIHDSEEPCPRRQ